MSFVNLYIKAPAGNGYTNPQAMKRVDDHLVQSTPAMMKSDLTTRLPQQETDGTWEVRVLEPSLVGFVKRILTQHYGLEIVREETIND